MLGRSAECAGETRDLRSGRSLVSVVSSGCSDQGGGDGRLCNSTAGSCDADLSIGGSDLSAGLRSEAAVGGRGVSVSVLAEGVRDPLFGGVREDRRRLRRRGAPLGQGARCPGAPVRQGGEQGGNRAAADRGGRTRGR